MFRRQDAAYKAAYIASHWLRHTTNFKPSAVEEARGLWMNVDDDWIDFLDIACELERDPTAIVGDVTLNQLHATVRAPFELLNDYCEDFDKQLTPKRIVQLMQEQEWYWYAYGVRNAISHNFRFEFSAAYRRRLPVSWNGMTITSEMESKPLQPSEFSHGQGYRLFRAMRGFATTLPDLSAT